MRQTLLVLGILMVAPLTTADATLLTYFTRAAFQADAPGLALEDFEASTLASGTAAAFAGPLNSTTNNAYFSTGSVLAGFSLAPTSGNIYNGRDHGGVATSVVSSNSFGADLNLSISVNAVGLDLNGFNGVDGAWSVDVHGAGGSLGAFNLPTGGFFGVISTSEDIICLALNKPNSGGSIDNFEYGRSTIPEPSTALLLGLGMLGAGLIRRKRRS